MSRMAEGQLNALLPELPELHDLPQTDDVSGSAREGRGTPVGPRTKSTGGRPIMITHAVAVPGSSLCARCSERRAAARLGSAARTEDSARRVGVMPGVSAADRDARSVAKSARTEIVDDCCAS